MRAALDPGEETQLEAKPRAKPSGLTGFLIGQNRQPAGPDNHDWLKLCAEVLSLLAY